MKFFLDTADLAEIEEAASWGALAGVTTNPTLYSRIGGKLDDFHAHIKRICDIVGPDCPVSAESVAMTRDEIVRDGRELAAIAPNVVVKIPTMVEGLAATRALADEGIPVNMTLCFTVPQAILAARAGARYISPFVGRFDDISEDGLAQLDDVVRAIGNYDFSEDTVNGEQIEIIAASIRSANHVTQAALMGNMDSHIFLGGSEPTTLKDLSEMLGKETIDAFNTSDTRGNSPSYGTTFQKMGHDLLSRDELAVLDGGKCILQLRGVRPFLSDKYDLTQHPNYKYTSDYDPKNALDIEKYLNRKEKINPNDEFVVIDADSLPSA